jgi:hypothetical protein
LRVRHDAVEDARLAVIGLHLDHAALTDGLVEIDVLLLAQGFDVIFEQVAEPLRRRKLSQDEHVLAERRGEYGAPAGLSQVSHGRYLYPGDAGRRR